MTRAGSSSREKTERGREDKGGSEGREQQDSIRGAIGGTRSRRSSKGRHGRKRKIKRNKKDRHWVMH